MERKRGETFQSTFGLNLHITEKKKRGGGKKYHYNSTVVPL